MCLLQITSGSSLLVSVAITTPFKIVNDVGGQFKYILIKFLPNLT